MLLEECMQTLAMCRSSVLMLLRDGAGVIDMADSYVVQPSAHIGVSLAAATKQAEAYAHLAPVQNALSFNARIAALDSFAAVTSRTRATQLRVPALKPAAAAPRAAAAPAVAPLVAVAAVQTFDPRVKSADMVLSNGNRTATVTGDDEWSFALGAPVSNVGVHRWRCTYTGGLHTLLGVLSEVPALGNNGSSQLPGSYTIQTGGGISYQAGKHVVGCPFVFYSGDEVTVTLDCTRGILRYESTRARGKL
jgi:hypothetical protein